MAHDLHFLKRLERLSLPHVEMALSLYRDTEMLQWVIQNANLIEHSDRVALALDDSDEPPHLVVTWEGKFVTCLAGGMVPDDHPVINRGQLDKYAGQLRRIRERISADSDQRGVVKVDKLFSRVFRASDEMSREEFDALSAWQPVLKGQFLQVLVETAQSVARRTTWLVDNVLRRPRARHRRALLTYWRHVFALGPLSLLASMDSKDLFEQLPLGSEIKNGLSWMTMAHGVTSIGLMALWGVGKVGKPLVAPYKQALVQQPRDGRFLDITMGLALIGLRHRQLNAEVSKALRGTKAIEAYASCPEWVEILTLFRDLLLEVVDGREDTSYVEHTGKKLGVELADLLEPRSRYRYRDVDEVPEDLWLPLCVGFREDFRHRQDALGHMVRLLPALARANARDLFLPRDLLVELHEPWTVEHTLDHLRNQARYLGERAPARTAPTPRRNEPCVCGSGKKYKHCCGRP